VYVAGNNIINIIEEFAPLSWVFPGDVCGLQWGDPDLPVQAVLLTLDFNEAVLYEALAAGANFVFTHHPFLYRPLSSLNLRERRGALLGRALKEGITLYSAHTNLDVAPSGVSQALAALFGLEKLAVLHPTEQDKPEKLVVFVPEGFEDKVLNALAEAGAGWIGKYSHCAFQLRGTGTFLPREGSNPFVGTPGVMEKVDEYRLETIIPPGRREAVLEAMRRVHPYEEVAYDLYPLSLPGQVRGLGRVGELPAPVTLGELALRCRELLQISSIKMLGEAQKTVQRVAVLGGSGAACLPAAIQKGAQVFISGDLCYHDWQKASDAGLALLDAGHAATEWPVISVVAAFLKERLKAEGWATEVIIGRNEEMNITVLE